MIQALSAYIKNIAIFLIFMSFTAIITPEKKYKQYIDLCLGFVLIIILLQPIGGLINGLRNMDIFNFGADAFETDAALVTVDDAALNAVQNEQIIKSYKEGLTERLISLVNQLSNETGYSYLSADFSIDDSDSGFGTILAVSLTVVPLNEDTNSKSDKPLIRVEKVDINPIPFLPNYDDNTDNGTDSQIILLKNFISDFYYIDVDNIYVNVQVS